MAGESQQVPKSAPDPTVLVTEAIERAREAERDLFDARIDTVRQRLNGMDEATKVLHESVTRTPTDIQIAVGHLREYHDEKFNSVAKQFEERDVRTAQASTASADALAAALQAAKELVGAQGEASAAAAVKAEVSTAKQIDQLVVIISTLEKSIGDRITEIKERIDRSSGGYEGATQAGAVRRAGISQVVAILGVVLFVISIAVSTTLALAFR